MIGMDELLNARVEAEDSGKRLDVFLSQSFADISRSYVQKLIAEGRVSGSQPIEKSGQKVKEGEQYAVLLPPPEILEAKPENIPLTVAYEDEDLIIVNKPRGMVVHPAPGNYSGTLVNALLYYFQGELSGINGALRPGIVHRIDKDTAGLLVVCKTDRAHRGMAEKLAVHDVERVYRGIVYGNIKEEEGTVNAPIGRDERDRKRMAITPGGRRAVTHYKVLERFGALTYIEARLETGRTHQIRVHMKSIGHPLLGDPVYGPGEVTGPAKTLLSGIPKEDLNGQFLVAQVLGFYHPVTGEWMHFECELPEYFLRVLRVLRKEG